MTLGLRGLIPPRMSKLFRPYIEITFGDKATTRSLPPSAEPSPYAPRGRFALQLLCVVRLAIRTGR
jgi:hypothetical protein